MIGPTWLEEVIEALEALYGKNIRIGTSTNPSVIEKLRVLGRLSP